jgi:hypothetical protein
VKKKRREEAERREEEEQAYKAGIALILSRSASPSLRT